VIGDQDPSLLSSVMRSRGTRAFYQVRIGADTRPAPTISATHPQGGRGMLRAYEQGRAGVMRKS
jgi:hypothetical protein